MARPAGQASHTAATVDLVGVARNCGIADARAIATMAEIEAFASSMQDVASGPRFASIKIDSANLERVLSSRDGTFIVTGCGAPSDSTRFSSNSIGAAQQPA